MAYTPQVDEEVPRQYDIKYHKTSISRSLYLTLHSVHFLITYLEHLLEIEPAECYYHTITKLLTFLLYTLCSKFYFILLLFPPGNFLHRSKRNDFGKNN